MRRFDGFLYGVNLGGWLSQYEDDSEEHFAEFITEQDIVKIQGKDHVRVPVDFEVLEHEDGTERELGYHYLDACVEWCRKNGLHMVLDLHKTFGYTFDPLEKEESKERFFYSEELQQRFYKLWERISKRYGSNGDMIAFELLNEVVSPRVVKEWNEIAGKACKLIRENAPDAYIIIGGVCYNNVLSVPMLEAPMDDKIVYNFHCYEPMIFTHQRAYWVDHMPEDLVVLYPDSLEEYRKKSEGLAPELADAINKGELTEIGPSMFDRLFQPAVQTAEERNVPLYCGEYGVIDLAPVDSAKRWFADIHSVFDKYGIGHAVWNYKEKDFGNMVQECLLSNEE